jgi:hypothetical protein
VDESSGDSAELRILKEAYDRIVDQAAKFSFPEEREYRAGMRDGAAMIQRMMLEITRAGA